MDDFKTSQDVWSLTEGQNAPGAPAKQWADEPQGAPGPVTQPVKGESIQIDAMQTSQQKADEHATPESGD